MRKQYTLDRGWSFELCDGQFVDLPHTWNKNGNVDRGRYVYVKDLDIDKAHKQDKLYLEFLGANTVCQVYLNDRFIGEHRGGYSTFRFELTQFYSWDGKNQLKVYVDNSQTEDVSPLLGDFTIYGGLYRSVNLICVGESHFDLMFHGSSGVILRPELDSDSRGILDIESHIVAHKDVKINYTLCDQDGRIVADECMDLPLNDKAILRSSITIDNCRMWKGKEDPYLYDFEAKLIIDDTIMDQIKIKTGFRKRSLDSDKGFLLNDKHFRINGVAKHQDFEGVGNAITSECLREDFDLIDDIGANSVRLSHYQHNQETYDICDSEGYVVWAEIPMMSMPDSSSLLDNAKEQLRELVYQNSHHPSICFWGIQNEIAMGGESLQMYKGVNDLNDLFHQILPKGISASANMYFVKNDSTLNFITDLLGYNHYFGWYYGKEEELNDWLDCFHKENPQVKLGISEYGADCNLKFHSDQPKVKDYSEEFQAVYHEKTYKIIESKPYLWGSYVWNMFDFGSSVRNEGGTVGKNAKGLVTFDRKVKKDAFYFYKSRWSDHKFVHLCEKRFVKRSHEKINIKAYSNLNELSLYVNDEFISMKSCDSVFIFEDIPLKMGENKVRVIGSVDNEDFHDESIWIRTEEKEESYVFVDPNPGLNVENWFTQEKSELDYFPEGYYSIKDKIGNLMKSKEAWDILREKAPQIVERATPDAPITLLWVFNKMRAVFTEEDIMDINNELIKIKKKDVLICIDSDGCAIDSMTIKHVEAFGPAFIEVWNVSQEDRDEILTEWNRINLYSLSRGINRFQGLATILEKYSYLDGVGEINKLMEWTQTTKALSATALKEAYDKSKLNIMHKALIWSDRVNEIIESMPLAKPFDGVYDTIKRLKEYGHIAVVSSANREAIEEEWKSCGLFDMVDYFYSQSDGTKAECIRKLKDKGYDKDRIIMIGDALGDYKAAMENDVWFYPILVTKESDSWKNFIEIYFEKFRQGQLNKENQTYWINNMKENLS